MNNCRYPVEAKAVGLIQQGRQKIYMFSILWSDRNNILIYRTFDAFKNLMKELKRKFPLEAGLVRKSERILPILKDVPLLFRSSKASSRDMERLHLLENYTQNLLQTDPKISQCEEIIQFFSPTNQDLTHSFPENSLVVMPSENRESQEAVSNKKQSSQPITQPVISQSYMSIQSFETKDTKNRPFKVNRNECIDVLIKDISGWWLVENEEKHLAWFPAPYLVNCEITDTKTSKEESLDEGKTYFAKKAYEAQYPDELSLNIGVIVEVIEKSNTGWWHIWYNGKSGYVPAMFLEPYKNPHLKLHVPFVQEKFNSTPNLANEPRSSDHNNKLDNSTNPGRSEQGICKMQLDRKRSRSLSGMAGTIDYLIRDTVMLQRDNSSRSFSAWDNKANQINQPTPSPIRVQMNKTQPLFENSCNMFIKEAEANPMKNSGFEEPFLRSVSKPLTLSPFDKSSSFLPIIPPRPTSQEICSRCTTITRKAVENTCPHPNM
ncbi:NADPH oxidase organizer 1 [Bombina bombina]|uniref:NADPH oxidase organizer 1 n=1 Tax=Bombina bombina TaxID=8345 RepID=UPI00235ABF05|nr:NADPH oxidase organizer 1 [Bombina bombina]